MSQKDPYTDIVREWEPVKAHIETLKYHVATNHMKWKKYHTTTWSWTPTMSYSPDPRNGWDKIIKSPPGTDPDTAARHYILYKLNGTQTSGLHTSSIGSFHISTTVDDVDLSTCKVRLNIWMYNAMSKNSFGRFVTHPMFVYRSMSTQYMWWNWKEEFHFDAKFNISNIPSSSSNW